MQKTKLMQELWAKSESTKDKREKLLLEIAGNLVEATFGQQPLLLAVDTALQDAMGKSRLREDLASAEEVNHLEWLSKRYDMAVELAELGVRSAMVLASRLGEELKHFAKLAE
jgi:hypothetical protein